MISVGVRFHNQDKTYNFNSNNLDLKLDDVVIVETDLGVESGEVVSIEKISDEKKGSDLKPILRKANTVDLEKIKGYKEKVKEAILFCRETINKYNLEMKLIDAHFSFDGSRVTFYFTADSRIDFRDLVKDLTRKFQKSVRLQQIGSRDAAAKVGDYGVCGRKLCCAKFLKEFESVTLDTARVQQVEHRGSDRLSGCCGRLLCCLSYESKTYEKLAKDMPEIGDMVKTNKGMGRVAYKHIIKQEVGVKLVESKDSREILNFKIDEIKWENK